MKFFQKGGGSELILNFCRYLKKEITINIFTMIQLIQKLNKKILFSEGGQVWVKSHILAKFFQLIKGKIMIFFQSILLNQAIIGNFRNKFQFQFQLQGGGGRGFRPKLEKIPTFSCYLILPLDRKISTHPQFSTLVSRLSSLRQSWALIH